MTYNSNSSLLSHPITLEYIKTYDIVSNFKNLIAKSLPSRGSGPDATQRATILGKFADRLTQIKMAEFDKSAATVTPQIINMTGSVDQGLNEIHVVFSQIVDELVNAKYELVEREHELAGLKKLRPMSGGGVTASVTLKIDESGSRETEARLLEMEETLSSKESVLRVKEEQLGQAETRLAGRELALDDTERLLAERIAQIAASETEIDELRRRIADDETRIKEERQAFSAQRRQQQQRRPPTGDKRPVSGGGVTDRLNTPVMDTRAESVVEEKYNEMQRSYKQLESKLSANSAEFTKQIE